ncbi:ABC transporter ATP-binding protein [Nonomuraea sp. B19D2]|uniref:ABC transporter ATP-binding protein n=1 Tax=Nonomuraea sp. B19D2 TaxID=3159561 RepID=UPI0032DACC4E
MAITLASSLSGIVNAWLMKAAIDELVASGDWVTIVRIAVGLICVSLVATCIPHASTYIRAEIERRVSVLAFTRLFDALDRFIGLARFEDSDFLDRLRLAQHSCGTTTQVSESILNVARATLTICGFVGSLLLINPFMAALAIVASLPVLVAEIALSKRRAKMYLEIGPIERREEFYNRLLSTVEAAKEVRLFGVGGFFRDRMMTDRRVANAEKRKVDQREAVLQGGLSLLSAAVSGAGLLWAFGLALTGELSVGSISVFVAALVGLQGSMTALTVDVARCHQGLLMFEHYMSITSAGADLEITAAPRKITALRHGIQFRDVWFRYADDHPWVLQGVTLYIPRGCTVALVGLNGSGKTTLVKLLCRLYDPTRGAVLWDGIDIRELDPLELRRRMSVMFQDFMEYDMSAGENISIGDISVPSDAKRVESAAKEAGVHRELSGLPRGYETLLSRLFAIPSTAKGSEIGVVLSGGQWQRVALARTFFRDQHRRDLMVLDEPSAGLDAAAEHEIHDSLRRLRRGRTSLLISHRLGSVRDADLIVVLCHGQVSEQGTHDTLLAANGIYARLFRLQASGYDSGFVDMGQ